MKLIMCIVFLTLTACGSSKNDSSSRLSDERYDGKKTTACIYNKTDRFALLEFGGYIAGGSANDATFGRSYSVNPDKGKIIYSTAYPIVVRMTYGGIKSITKSIYPPESGDLPRGARVPDDQCNRTYSYRLDIEKVRIKGDVLKLRRAKWIPSGH